MAEQKTTPGGTTYTDYLAAQDISNEKERQAYLALMARHGMEAKRIWDEQKVQDAALAEGRGATQAPAGSSDAAIAELMGSVTSQTDQAALSHQSELARIAAANEAYLRQVKGSVNIEDVGTGGGGGGSRSGSGSGSGSGGLDDFLLDDLFGDSLPEGDPSDILFDYSQEQLDETSDLLDKGVRGQGLVIRQQLEEMMASGASKDEMAGALADFLENSGMDRQRQGQLATTMDNYFGLSPEGARGAATVDLYYTEEDQEFDRMQRRASGSRPTKTQTKRNLFAQAQEALALKNNALNAMQKIEDAGVGRVSIPGQGVVYDPSAAMERYRQQVLDSQAVLNDLLSKADDENVDLGITEKQADADTPVDVPGRRQGSIPKNPADRGPADDGSQDRAERLRAERAADAARRAEEDRTARAAADERRRQAEADRIAAARQRDADARRMAAERARLEARRSNLRRRWGKTFNDDEYMDDEFIGQADTDFERLAEERRRASIMENRNRTMRTF